MSRKHGKGCRCDRCMPIPVAGEHAPAPAPAVPPPPCDARFREIDAWAGHVNQRLAALEEAARPAYPDGAPPGVVSPHVAQNLAAIRAWCSPTINWLDARAALDGIEALIVVAQSGGDVPMPMPLDERHGGWPERGEA